MHKFSSFLHLGTTQKNTSGVPRKKHYVCQYSHCNNRCDGNCDVNNTDCYVDRYYSLYSGSTTGSYTYTGGDYVGHECKKCGRGFLHSGYHYFGYECKECGHFYCYNCCFKWKILISKDNNKEEYGFFWDDRDSQEKIH